MILSKNFFAKNSSKPWLVWILIIKKIPLLQGKLIKLLDRLSSGIVYYYRLDENNTIDMEEQF